MVLHKLAKRILLLVQKSFKDLVQPLVVALMAVPYICVVPFVLSFVLLGAIISGVNGRLLVCMTVAADVLHVRLI